jgi:hypothetical protein
MRKRSISFASTLLLLIFLMAIVEVRAQNMLWSRTYGGTWNDGAFAVLQSNDGGLVMAGFSSSYSTNHVEDVYLIKTDAQGNQLWSRTIGTNLEEIATDIKQTSDGGYIVTGYKQVSSVNDPFLIKTDSSGNVLWERNYDYGLNMDDRSHSVCQTSDGGYIFAGQTRIVDQFPNYDMYVVRTDQSGNVIWMRTYRHTNYGNDVAMSVVQLDDGGFFFGGTTQSSIWSSFVIRTNAAGDIIWTKTRPDDYQSECYSVIKTSDGNLVLSGTSVSFETDTDILIEKLDMNGNQLWEKIYGGENSETGQSIKEVTTGGYVLSGMASTLTSGWDVYVMQTNSLGDSLWSRRFGGSSDDRGWAIETLNDGSVAAAGWVYSFGAGGGDVYLLKLTMQNITGIDPLVNQSPSFRLHQNYPNPFNPSTKIRYEITNKEFVSLKVYNTLGQLVKILVDEYRSPGSYEVEFEGNELPGGAYFYRLITGEFTETKKMMLSK